MFRVNSALSTFQLNADLFKEDTDLQAADRSKETLPEETCDELEDDLTWLIASTQIQLDMIIRIKRAAKKIAGGL